MIKSDKVPRNTIYRRVGKIVDNRRRPGGAPVVENTVTVYADGMKLNELIDLLVDLNVKYSAEYENLRLQEESCDCSYECGCTPNLILFGNIVETDLEYNFRVEYETRRADAALKLDRLQYEALKKKFEKEEK